MALLARDDVIIRRDSGQVLGHQEAIHSDDSR